MATHLQRQSDAKLEVVDDEAAKTLDGPQRNSSLTAPPRSAPHFRMPPGSGSPPSAAIAPASHGELQTAGSALCPCPACDGEQTQPVSAIYSALTSPTQPRRAGGALILAEERLRRSVSMFGGVGTPSMQQSQLARRLAPPVMDCTRLVEAGRSRVAVAGGGALVACFVVMAPLIVLGNQAPALPSGPAVQQAEMSNFGRTLMAVAAVALFGVPIFVFAKFSARFDEKIARIREEEWAAFDRKKQAWKSSLFCHGCGNVFHRSRCPEE